MITLILVLSTCVKSSDESLTSRSLHCSEVPNQSVNRLSYGVIFDYYQDVVMTTEIWAHVFVIKLPQKDRKKFYRFCRRTEFYRSITRWRYSSESIMNEA